MDLLHTLYDAKSNNDNIDVVESNILCRQHKVFESNNICTHSHSDERTAEELAVVTYGAGGTLNNVPLSISAPASSTNFGVQGQSPAQAPSTQHPGITSDIQGIHEALSSCGKWAIATNCTNDKEEHHIGKELYCGLEWCPTCGQKESIAHMRRVSRWIPKARQLRTMGYLDIEFSNAYRFLGRDAEYLGDPRGNTEDIRGYCYSRDALRHTTDTIIDVLRGRGLGRRGKKPWRFDRGLGRWHYFGEEGINGWNPHFNVLVDASVHLSWHKGRFNVGAMPKRSLNALKIALHDALGLPYKLDAKGRIQEPALIVHYDYTDKPGKMYHWIKYVTRATFLNYSWDEYMARQLFGGRKGFRNCRSFGKWEDAPAWDLTAAVEEESKEYEELESLMAIHDNKCPICGCELEKWTKPFGAKYLDIWGAVPMGNTGYYRIPQGAWAHGEVSPAMAVKLAELEAQTRKIREDRGRLFVEACLSRIQKKPGEDGFFNRWDAVMLWHYGREREYSNDEVNDGHKYSG